MNFLPPKTKRSLRSILAGMSLFMAGAPAMVEAAPQKAPTPISQRAETSRAKLINLYRPLCEQLEGNLPFCYNDNGAVTLGCGVHFKDHKSLENLTAIKISLKNGKSLSLRKIKYLNKMANADWKNPKTLASFPEVAKVQIVKLKDCKGTFPKPNNKKWEKDLFLIPQTTLNTVNNFATNFCIQKAQEIHPNLYQMAPSAQLVVLDLIYNLGHNKYKDTYPKFQKAIRTQNFKQAQKECKTGNKRRDTVRSLLMDSIILISNNNGRYGLETVKKVHQKPAVKKDYFLSMVREPTLWKILDNCTNQNHKWQENKKLLALNQAMKKLIKKS